MSQYRTQLSLLQLYAFGNYALWLEVTIPHAVITVAPQKKAAIIKLMSVTIPLAVIAVATAAMFENVTLCEPSQYRLQ